MSKAASDIAAEVNVPLVVDLDGTLIKTDLLWESFVRLIRRNPFYVFLALVWWARGRANLKRQLAIRVTLSPFHLPYHAPLLEFLRSEHERGRKLILATASDINIARPIGEYVGVFDDILGSDGKSNLRGNRKAAALCERFGEKGFDYAGNSVVDLPVWRQCRQAVVVNAGESLAARAAQVSQIGRTFLERPRWPGLLLKTLRPHQWVKNLIVFIPMLASHRWDDAILWHKSLTAFMAFCLCASSVYVYNDLLDIEADRQHPAKRRRPFASGNLTLPVGLILAPVLAVLGLSVGAALSWEVAALLLLYLGVTTAYSTQLKQVALLDVFVLAGVYTLRLVAGHLATAVPYSGWLLAFSIFIFLSLALAKRFAELIELHQANHTHATGRGYVTADRNIVTCLGTVNGSIAALVLALYVSSQDVRILYQNPTLLLLVCPLFLYWISRVWMLAHRGQLHEDPVVFALRDRTSYMIAALVGIVVWLATIT